MQREGAIHNAQGLREFQRGDWDAAIGAFGKARDRAAEMMRLQKDAAAVSRMQAEIQALADSLRWVGVEERLPEGFSAENPYEPREKKDRGIPAGVSRAESKKRVGRSSSDGLGQVLRPALNRLGTSEEGKKILEFLAVFKIRFEYSERLGPNTGAAYNRDERTILLPRDAWKSDPVWLAVSIGHEGHHAVQALSRRMEPSIEAEQGANFMDRVIYHEMIQAGAARLPKGNFIEGNFVRFTKQVKNQKFRQFEEDIKILYRKQRVPAIKKAVGRAPAFLQPALRWVLMEPYSGPLRVTETLDEQSGKMWNLFRLWSLKRTRRQRDIEREWEQKWMKENQKEFKKLYP